MGNFNFGTLANVQPSSNNSYLKPYTINENVVIKKTEVKEGVSKDGNNWKALSITFGNDEGIYIESMFYFDENNPKVVQRSTFDQPNGGKREAPSTWETTRDKMAAIGLAFNPDGFKKMQEMASKFKTCSDLMNAFKTILDKVIDKNPTNMKLVGRNSDGTIYATLPKCTGIAQAKDDSKGVAKGEWYTWMISPFGNKLFFSPYEEKQKNEINTAKPTPMNDINKVSTTEEEFDIASLL